MRKKPMDNSDRFLHDLVSASLCGVENMKRDACLDSGISEHGSQHRNHFPHRNLYEMVGYMCWRDVVDGRKPNLLINSRLAVGHVIVDGIPTHIKKRLQLLNTLSSLVFQ